MKETREEILECLNDLLENEHCCLSLSDSVNRISWSFGHDPIKVSDYLDDIDTYYYLGSGYFELEDFNTISDLVEYIYKNQGYEE